MRQQASVEIARPIDEVFEYTNNNVAEWSLTVVEDEMLETTPERIGSTFRCVTEDHGCRMDFSGEVIRYEPPNLSRIYLTGKRFDIDAEYRFEGLDGATRVTLESVVYPRGLTRVFFVLAGWMFHKSGCRAQQAELDNLKQILEGRSVSTTADPSASRT